MAVGSSGNDKERGLVVSLAAGRAILFIRQNRQQHYLASHALPSSFSSSSSSSCGYRIEGQPNCNQTATKLQPNCNQTMQCFREMQSHSHNSPVTVATLDVDVFGGGTPGAHPGTPEHNDQWKRNSKIRWIARSNHATQNKKTTASQVANRCLPLAPLSSPTPPTTRQYPPPPAPLPPPPDHHRFSSPRTKRVSFPTNHQGEIVPTCFTYECRAADRIGVLWWTAAEITAMQDNVLYVCEFFVRFRADYARIVVDLISACTDTATASRHTLRKRRALLDVANAYVRGLEATIVTILEQRQRRTVGQVLQHQERLRTHASAASKAKCDLKCTSSAMSLTDESIHLLAVQYRSNSRYAALWAELMADGDALVVEDETLKYG
jgi:hypothetical protein